MLHRKNREEWRGKEGGTEGGELERICEVVNSALRPQAAEWRCGQRRVAASRRGDEVEPWRSSGRRRIEETRHERANERAIAAWRSGMRETARRVRVRGRPRARLL